MGDAAYYRSTTGGPATLYVVATSPEPVTAAGVADTLGGTKTAAYVTLMKLYRSGFVERYGEGHAHDPYRYRLAPRGGDDA